MTGSRSVLVVGVPGYNLGDLAISLAMDAMLREAGVAEEITHISIRRGVVAAAGLDEFYFDRRAPGSWLRLWWRIRHASLVVIGGGSIVQDKVICTPLRGLLPLFLQVSSLARLARKPIITAPIGVDQLFTERGVRYGRRLLRRCSRIAVRDSLSLRQVQSLCPDVQPTRLCDPVLALTSGLAGDASVESKPTRRDGKSEGMGEGDYVVISLVREETNDRDLRAVFETLLTQVRQVYAPTLIVLLAMESRDTDELGFYRQYCADGERSVPLKIVQPTRVAECLGWLRDARAVVAMRYHVCLMCVGLVPVFVLSRSTKTHSLMLDFGLPGVEYDELVSGVASLELAKDAVTAEDLLQQREAIKREASRCLAYFSGSRGGQNESADDSE